MTRRLLAALASAMVACTGTILVVEPDGGDATTDAPAPSDASSDIQDAGADWAWWFAQFDVYEYDGRDPPYPGEYPLSSDLPCTGDVFQDAQTPYACDPIAQCDTFTGWCCSGELDKLPGCTCGYGLGCLPPNVCCNLPDALVPSCVDGMAACPGGSRPWFP